MGLVQGHTASQRDPSSQSTTGNAHKHCWELQAAQPPLLLYVRAHIHTQTHTQARVHTTEVPIMQSFPHDVTLTFPLLCLCSQVAPSTRNAPPFARPRSFPSGSEGKASACNQGRPGFKPWVRKILWRRKWQPTPVLLSGKSHGQRSLVGYSPWDPKESDMIKHEGKGKG